jgi:hypothetical protein
MWSVRNMIRTILAIFLSALLWGPVAEAAWPCDRATADGEHPFVVSFPHTGTTLLSGFDFSIPGDHHIRTLSIWPDGQNLNLNFTDQSGHDYCYNVLHFDITDPRISSGFATGSQNNARCTAPPHGTCTVQLNKPAGDFVFVLNGFHLGYVNTDHHIKNVEIHEDNGQLAVTYADQNGDDPFVWNVQYAYVPRDLFSQVSALGEGAPMRGDVELTGAIPAGKAVLRGFSFKFNNDDHHLQRITVMPDTTGFLRISYRDQNADDSYKWLYEWALLR